MSKVIGICIVFLIGAIIIFQFMGSSPDKPQIKTLAEQKSSTVSTEATPTDDIVSTPANQKEIIQEEEQDEEPEIAEDSIASETESNLVTPATISPEQKDEIHQFLTVWKKAWQNTAGSDGNIESYMKLYHSDFISANLDKKGWEESKAKRNMRKDWIEVWLNNVKIIALPDNNTMQASFKQEYSSSNYSDISSKILTLKRTDGEWLILAEN
jgi:hypothetical protein